MEAADRFGNPLLGEGHDAYLFRRQTGLSLNAGAVWPQVRAANPQYFLKVAIPSLYAHTRETVTSNLQGVEYFAATADMWSSNTLASFQFLWSYCF